jgi:hypothetical protein
MTVQGRPSIRASVLIVAVGRGLRCGHPIYSFTPASGFLRAKKLFREANSWLARKGRGDLRFTADFEDAAARYDRMFPGDPKHRDFRSWHAFEMSEPRTFSGMYSFFCRKD